MQIPIAAAYAAAIGMKHKESYGLFYSDDKITSRS